MNEQIMTALDKLSEISGIPLQIKDKTFANSQEINQEEVDQLVERLNQMAKVCQEISSEEHFFRSLLLGTQTSDYYIIGKKFLPAIEKGGYVFIIKTKTNTQEMVIQTLKGLYPDKRQHVVIPLSEEQTVVISFQNKVESDLLHQQAMIIATILNTEAMCMAQVAVGSHFKKRDDCHQSFEHALLAYTIGKQFSEATQIHVFSTLGISRLIYELPQQACDDYLREVFQDKPIPIITEETIVIAEAFFQQNLNVSETSRQLFMHRNTLLHKLDRIQEVTGLDIRNFQDAISMKLIILMKKKIVHETDNH